MSWFAAVKVIAIIAVMVAVIIEARRGLAGLWADLAEAFREWRLHRQSLDISPAHGQIWVDPQRGVLLVRAASLETVILEIEREDGTVSTWRETVQEWEARVLRRRLYLAGGV